MIEDDLFFNFYLTDRQTQITKRAVDYAEKKYWQGDIGAVFCQIGQSRKGDSGLMLVRGCYLPKEAAEQIQAIIKEYAENAGKSTKRT